MSRLFLNATQKEKIETLRAFLDTQLFGVLATIGKNGPHTNIITYAFTDHLDWLIFSTPTESRKYKNILSDPRVAFFVDSRPLSTERIENSMGVTLKGMAQNVSAENLNSFTEIYLKRHPGMKHFLQTSGNCLLAIRVKQLEIITDLREVELINLS